MHRRATREGRSERPRGRHDTHRYAPRQEEHNHRMPWSPKTSPRTTRETPEEPRGAIESTSRSSQGTPGTPKDPPQNHSRKHMLAGSHHVLPTQALSRKAPTWGSQREPQGAAKMTPRETSRPRREPNADKRQHLSASQAKPNRMGVQNSAPLGTNHYSPSCRRVYTLGLGPTKGW